MSHKRKQYERNKQRNWVAKNNEFKGGVHGATKKAERKHTRDALKQLEDEYYE